MWLFDRIAQRAGSMMSETIAGVMVEAFKHPEVQTLLQERMASAPLSAAVLRIVDKAVERGELPPVEVPQRVLRLPLELIRADAITRGGVMAEDLVTGLVDEIYLPLLRGLAHSAPTSGTPTP